MFDAGVACGKGERLRVTKTMENLKSRRYDYRMALNDEAMPSFFRGCGL